MKKNSNKKGMSPFIAVFLIVSSVFLLLAIFITIQRSYSLKLKELNIRVSSGPVSPEFQQTQSLSLTKNSCTLTTTKSISQETTTQNCQPPGEKFEQIQKAVNDYGIIDKLSEDSSKNLTVGGKEISFSITLNDGTQVSTKGGSDFIESIQPFLDQLGLYLPQVRQLNL